LAIFVQDDKKHFVSGSWMDRKIKIWDAADHHRCETILIFSSWICSLETFTIDGHNCIACGGGNPYEIEMWKIETKTVLRK